MTSEQVIDEIADDGVRLVPELCHHAANERSTSAVPLQVDRPVKITGAMDLRPTMRASGLLGPDLDESKFFFQLRIAHDLVAQRLTPGRDHLDYRLHFTLSFSRKSLLLQCLFHVTRAALPAKTAGRHDYSASRQQRTKHDINIDISVFGMAKRAGKGADDFETELLPKMDRRGVRGHDEVKLNRPETKPTGLTKTMFGHSSPHSGALCVQCDHESHVRDMR